MNSDVPAICLYLWCVGGLIFLGLRLREWKRRKLMAFRMACIEGNHSIFSILAMMPTVLFLWPLLIPIVDIVANEEKYWPRLARQWQSVRRSFW